MLQTLNKSNKLFFLLLVACIHFLAGSRENLLFAQAKPKFKKTIRGEALIPRPISNKAFKQLFSGVFSANVSMNFGVNNFNTGLYYNMMQSQIFPKYQFEPHSIQTVHTVGIRLGYDIYPSKTKMASTTGNFIVVSPFIAGGFNQIDYSRLQCIAQHITSRQDQAYNVYLGSNFNLMFSEYDGVGFTVGYNFLNHEFNPDALCLNEWFLDITDKDKQGLSQYILFGFNVHFDLAKREDGSQ